MSNFKAFMKANAISVENVKYVASKRFIDPETNEPIEWELKAIGTALDEAIRKECTKRVPVQGKRGAYTPELDIDAYTGKLCVACTVYPDLNNAELQEDYGVMGGVALLKAMLTSGEYAAYKEQVATINGYDLSMDELVDEAKN